MVNLAYPDRPDWAMDTQAQLEAANLLHQVKIGKLTKAQIHAQVQAMADGQDKELLRKWLNHFARVAALSAPPKPRQRAELWRQRGRRR